MSRLVYPPGPKSRFFGLDLQRASERDPLGFMVRIAREYGDIAHFKIGWRHVYLLNHPEHIKGVLLSHYDSFLKGRGVVRRHKFPGKGLLTSEGNFHRRQRQLTKPAFHQQRFTAYGATMARVAADISESWREGDRLDVLEAMRAITLPIATQTLFGTMVETEHEKIIAAFRTGLHQFRSFKPGVTSIYDFLAITRLRKLRQALLEVEAVVSRIITERLSEDEDRGDLLSLLLSRMGEGEEFTSERQIRDEAMTIFIGGFENVANALTWTWYLLAQHPEAQDRLTQELDDVLSGRLPTADDLARLDYTRMVIEEAMRIYPPVPRLVRTALHDYRVGGYTIPAGALVVVSQYLMHRDARYFPEPERFDPQRWTPEAKAARPAYSYFPFGGGPRRCIGDGFAYMEAVLVLATIASRWRFSLTSHEPIGMTATHFLHPKENLIMIAGKRMVREEVEWEQAVGASA